METNNSETILYGKLNSESYLNQYFNETLDPFNILKKRLIEFTYLGKNWDGYGGLPLIEEIKDVSACFMASLGGNYIDLISDIFPNPNGTVTIEWENNSEEKLSLEIGQNNYSYFVTYTHKQPKFVDGANIISDIKILTEDISELFSEILFAQFFGTGESS